MPNLKLFLHIKNLLTMLHEEETPMLETLSLMITGLFLGRHVQLWAIALWIPKNILLLSIVRQLERFVSNPKADVEKIFEPFIWAMVASLGNETAYLLIDCTQAGPKCRTLLIGIAYHGTVLPIVWETVKGKKGHVTGERQKKLLEKVEPYCRGIRHVVVLGDAEFSNESVIRFCQQTGWDFVFRFQKRYKIQINQLAEWQTAATLVEEVSLTKGNIHHWQDVSFTEAHQFSGLTFTWQWDKNQEDPIFLIASLTAAQNPHEIYEFRFWIETLFGQHKSRGFNLNRTQMETPAHIDRLVLAVAIASCLVLGLGTHLVLIKNTKLVDRADRRDLSLFQLGWRYFFRLLSQNRLSDFKMRFSWNFTLPPPGFQPA